MAISHYLTKAFFFFILSSLRLWMLLGPQMQRHHDFLLLALTMDIDVLLHTAHLVNLVLGMTVSLLLIVCNRDQFRHWGRFLNDFYSTMSETGRLDVVYFLSASEVLTSIPSAY